VAILNSNKNIGEAEDNPLPQFSFLCGTCGAAEAAPFQNVIEI
jgi:hypothetical protein